MIQQFKMFQHVLIQAKFIFNFFYQNLDRITGVQSMEIHFTNEFLSLSETKL